MKSYYDEELKELQQKIAIKKRCEAELRSLKEQKSELEDKVYKLRTQKIEEQEDVDKLEGRTLAAFFYYVVGKRDKMLDKEREEAYAAAVKYDAAVSELAVVEDSIQHRKDTLQSIKNCELKYKTLLDKKAEEIRNSDTPEGVEILKLEEEIVQLESAIKEIDEAISAGNKALSVAESIFDSLDSASGWSTWDMIGGGLISDMAKYSHIDAAQDKVETLQDCLRRFKTELADVKVNTNVNVHIDSVLQFADYFFDGLFVDWMVHDKIEQSKSQVSETKHKIEKIIEQLKSMQYSKNNAISAARYKIEEILTN